MCNACGLYYRNHRGASRPIHHAGLIKGYYLTPQTIANHFERMEVMAIHSLVKLWKSPIHSNYFRMLNSSKRYGPYRNMDYRTKKNMVNQTVKNMECSRGNSIQNIRECVKITEKKNFSDKRNGLVDINMKTNSTEREPRKSSEKKMPYMSRVDKAVYNLGYISRKGNN